MDKEYSVYICKSCKKDNIFINELVEANKREGRYISCGYCGSKHIVKEKEFDSIKECMNHISFKRHHGAISSRER